MDSMTFRPGYAAVFAERFESVQQELKRILGTEPVTFVWEVGCGHGHFLNAYAAAHPEKICIGVDLVSERIARADKKRDRAKLRNLHFIRADARLFVDALPSSARIADLFILFPDPWPKSRHHKHRVLQPEFLAKVAPRAASDCNLYFRTDYLPYHADARATIDASPHWELADAPWPFEFETVFQSRAESHASLVARKRRM